MKILIIPIFYFLLFQAFAQQGNLEVTYRLSLKQPDPIDTEARLQITGKSSFFTWDNTSGSLKSDQREDGAMVLHIREPDSIGTINWMNLDSDSLKTRFKQIGKSYLLREGIPEMHWKLTKQRKKIAGFNCFKAETRFRGRDYIVWFTPEIPVKLGPWKFNGLPGLILEAFDQERFLYLYARKIVSGNKPQIPDLAIWNVDQEINLQELQQLQENLVEELYQKIFSKMPRGVVVNLESSEQHFLEREFEH